MPDRTTRHAVEQINAERGRLIAEIEAAKIDPSALEQAIKDAARRRDETERRAAKHGGIPLSILRMLLSSCPSCHSFGRLDLKDPLHVDDDNEVWVAHCWHCTASVEADSPQAAAERWNQGEGIVVDA